MNSVIYRHRILIMGLPGSGKSELATELRRLIEEKEISVERLDGEKACIAFDDYDFSEAGFLNQAVRLSTGAHHTFSDIVIVDFIAPTLASQIIFYPKLLIWMDTIQSSRHPDTDDLFTPPTNYHFRVTDRDYKKWAQIIFDHIEGTFFNE